MGVLTLEFRSGDNAESLGLDGTESFDITGHTNSDSENVTVTATAEDGSVKSFAAKIRIDTAKERE